MNKSDDKWCTLLLLYFTFTSHTRQGPTRSFDNSEEKKVLFTSLGHGDDQTLNWTDSTGEMQNKMDNMVKIARLITLCDVHKDIYCLTAF